MENESLHFYTLPGGGQLKDGVYYQVLDQDKRVSIIKEAFGVEVEKWPPIVLKDSPEYIEEQEQKRKEEEKEERESRKQSEGKVDTGEDKEEDKDREKDEENGLLEDIENDWKKMITRIVRIQTTRIKFTGYSLRPLISAGPAY